MIEFVTIECRDIKLIQYLYIQFESLTNYLSFTTALTTHLLTYQKGKSQLSLLTKEGKFPANRNVKIQQKPWGRKKNRE